MALPPKLFCTSTSREIHAALKEHETAEVQCSISPSRRWKRQFAAPPTPRAARHRRGAVGCGRADRAAGCAHRQEARRQDRHHAAAPHRPAAPAGASGMAAAATLGETEGIGRLESLLYGRSLRPCLDSQRIPLNEKDRSSMSGSIPYCGANGILEAHKMITFSMRT